MAKNSSNKQTKQLPDDMDRISVICDKDLKSRLRIHCANESCTMTDVVLQLIQEYLEENE